MKEFEGITPLPLYRDRFYGPLKMADKVCSIVSLDFTIDKAELPTFLAYMRNLWEECEPEEKEERAVIEAVVKLYCRG